MGKLKDITPERFRCGPSISACPAIYEEGENYVVVGADVSRSHAASAGSQFEAAVRVSREMIDEAVA
ncbi:MAG: hypothetical protein ACOC7J_06745, partial [Armatimonadota bacterium]